MTGTLDTNASATMPPLDPGVGADSVLAGLQRTIAARRLQGDADQSYVARLHRDGLPRIARKVGEEAIETMIAALSGSGEDVTAEAADLLFHVLVLLDAREIPIAAVLAELARRENLSGLAEKAARTAASEPSSD